ncbi:ClpP/crotonase-like domain-containing protein [Melampsora americana]|nr:ClpP/crotonase-like domain-containing protein [Melampsora americana]
MSSFEIDYLTIQFQTIKIEIKSNQIIIIYLNRPTSHNSWNVLMQEELVRVYGLIDQDNRIKVVILSSVPVGRHFCVGADLSKGDFSNRGQINQKRNLKFDSKEYRDPGGKVALAIYRLRKLTIAAINGDAVGIGITMTLPFDIRIVWSNSKIGFLFAKRGITPEACSSFFLPKLIGVSKSLEIFLTADLIPAHHLSLQGLFYRLIEEQDQVLPTALELAERLCEDNSVVSMVMIKQLVWNSFSTAEEQHLIESEVFHKLGNSFDSQESVKAFKEKRKSKFLSNVPEHLIIKPWWRKIEVRSEVECKSKSKL